MSRSTQGPTLSHSLTTSNANPVSAVPATHSPLFVTWTKAGSWGKPSQLRGCIGTLEPRQLHTALKDYALTRWGPGQLLGWCERALALLLCKARVNSGGTMCSRCSGSAVLQQQAHLCPAPQHTRVFCTCSSCHVPRLKPLVLTPPLSLLAATPCPCLSQCPA